jgi:serine protease Do
MIHLDRSPLALLLIAISAAGASMGPAQAQLGASQELGVDEQARLDLYESLRSIERETPEARVAQAVKPSVVYVETEMVQNVRTIFGFQRQVMSGSGSGVVIHPSGFIVTNYHVVEGAQQITVSFDGDPNEYPARMMSAVREEDLALLKIEPVDPGSAGSATELPDWDGDGVADLRPAGERSFPTVRMGTSSDLMPGERVVAIGNPHGQTYTVSTGIISGLYREVPVPGRQLHFRGLIQTDASINRGNSGGPLLNIHGELIGINTVMNTDAENIGFAIPVDRVRQVLTDSLFPDARRAWLGFDVEEQAGELVVTRVWDQGPAAAAGICQADRVLSLNGIPVQDAEDYLLQSLQIDSGAEFTVGIARPDSGAPDSVTLQSWDDMNGRFFSEIGVTVAERKLGRSRFLMVQRVRDGSSAAELGLMPGDVIPAVRARTQPRSGAIRLSDKATLQLVLDRLEPGTEIEVDAYRDLNGDSTYQRDELLKGVLVR